MVKKIHQIWISDVEDGMSDFLKSQANKLKNLYYDYEYKLWDKQSIQKFLKENYHPHILNSFNKIKPYAFKADLARYALLFKLGGYYFDIALCPEFKFEPNNEVVFRGITIVQDINHPIKKSLYIKSFPHIENNILLFPNPGSMFLKKAIEYSCLNIKRSDYTDHPLGVTSPVLLSNIIKDFDLDIGEVKVNGTTKASYYKDKLFCYHKPTTSKPGLKEQGGEGTNNYEEMWFNQDLYN